MKTLHARLGRWLLVLGAWLSTAPALAQGPVAPPNPDRFRGHVRLGGMIFDNFFEATEGPKESVLAAILAGGLAFRLTEGSPFEVHLAAERVIYEGFDPSSTITAGLRFQAKPHAWNLTARYLRGRPGREVGDEFDRVNAMGLAGEYSYRITKEFEVFGLAQVRHETSEFFPDRTVDGHAVGAGVRYRGPHNLSPEIGVTVGGRSVSQPGEDLSQREGYLALRWTPTRSTYVSARYRRRGRSYTIADAAARNFGREDTRHQLTLAADWTRGNVVWNLYYTLEDANSSQSSGNFTTQMLSLGLTFQF